MLENVRAFKDAYYHAAWARYDLAKPGSLVVIPNTAAMYYATSIDDELVPYAWYVAL